MEQKKLLIIDDSVNLKKIKIDFNKFDRRIYIHHNPKTNIAEIFKNFEKPKFNADEIEKLAYKLCNKEIDEYFNKHKYLDVKFKEAVKKSMLHVYGYYYKKAKIELVLNNINTNERIYIFSRYYNKNISIQKKQLIVENFYNKIKSNLYLIFLIINKIKNVSLFEKEKKDNDNNIFFDCKTFTNYKMLNYIFPDISKGTFIFRKHNINNQRVNVFFDFINRKKYKNVINDYKISLLDYVKSLHLIVFALKSDSSLQHIIMIFYIHNIFLFYFYDRFVKKQSIEVLFLSEEYSSVAEIYKLLSMRYNFKLINYQHGGVYLFDHDFDYFIVMGEWVKKYYIENTKSKPKQFLVLGNPNLEKVKNIKFKLTKNKKLKILFASQYLMGYVTYETKEKLIKTMKEVSKINGVELYIKEHPSATDSIINKYLSNNDNIKILEQFEQIKFENYNLVLSFYSTVLIESILNGVPAISLNIENIKNIATIQYSGIIQLNCIDEIINFIKTVIKDNKILKKIIIEERKKINCYWNNDISAKKIWNKVLLFITNIEKNTK